MSVKLETSLCLYLGILNFLVFSPLDFCSEIWARFLAFESNIRDLASILKVEKRYTAFKEEYEGKETALLVDRYKFMDLYPCSTSELKALGYKDVSRAKLAALIPDPVIAPSIAPSLKDDVDRKPEYPKPDTSQTIPFQPRHLAPPGLHPVPGGVFPVPPAAVILMKLLPPPICFQVSVLFCFCLTMWGCYLCFDTAARNNVRGGEGHNERLATEDTFFCSCGPILLSK
eukprot:XP_004914283.1 PREDICTED: cleavage stimulation factor subunit 3-like [Xenopus tropicalis]